MVAANDKNDLADITNGAGTTSNKQFRNCAGKNKFVTNSRNGISIRGKAGPAS
jgi:hypothetical protein